MAVMVGAPLQRPSATVRTNANCVLDAPWSSNMSTNKVCCFLQATIKGVWPVWHEYRHDL